jgi:hypothetical protein
MRIVFANNQMLVADTTATVVTTDPVPVDDPDLNHVMVTVQIHRIFAMGASAAYSLTVDLEGSNDGQTWFPAQSSGALTTPADDTFNGDFLFAYVRAQMTLVATSGDWAAAAFDVHANFLDK